MADNNEPWINANGQEQINQYAKSFDSLRTSINSLSAPVNKLDNDLSALTDSVSKLNSAGNPVSDTINKISKASGDATSVMEGFKKVIDIVKVGAISLEEALTGGLTILIAFAPEIIKWVGEMMKGTTTLSALNKTLKDNKIVMDAVNQAKLQGTQNAQQELVQLKLLYTASQDHNLKLSERKKIISQLQGQYPDYFGKMSTEAILNGKATKSYDDLTKSIIAASRARAAEDLMVKNQERQLGNDDKLTKLSSDLTKYNKLVAEAQKAKNIVDHSFDAMGGGNSASAKNKELASKFSDLQDQRDAIQKTINDYTTDSKLLDKQNQALAKAAITDTEKHGASVLNVASASSAKFNQSKAPKSSANDKQRGHVENLQAMSVNFAQTIELEKKNYDTEQTALDNQLKNKLISQEDYQKQSQQLQDQYHQNLGAKVKDFNEVDFDSAKKNLQGIVQQNEEEQAKITESAKKHAQERKAFELQTAQQVSNTAFSILQNSIKSQSDAKIKQLETQKQSELNNSSLTTSQKQAIEDKYKKKEAEVKVKAFKDEQKASILQAVINGALAVTKATAQSGMLSAFVIPGIIAETAIQVATIASQKAPQYAKGGIHYRSDGKGALLSGYSRTDNTNAYLRSGEAVVVSEAMRDPWARNLVSAINVAYGGRDFSAANPTRGYAIGGIFTDGGNSNRYYNQPVSDQKDLANTIAYQMINNFPPVYVDVKDINNQQNILAQTINRVNL
jgi:hypothetical protein